MKQVVIEVYEESINEAVNLFLEEWDENSNEFVPPRWAAYEAIVQWLRDSIDRALEQPGWYGLPASTKNTPYPSIDFDILRGE